MPDLRLYTIVISGDAQMSSTETASRNTQSQPLVSDGVSSSTSTGSKPGSRTLKGQFRGKRSRILSKELSGLFDAPGFESVPMFATSGPQPDDGYYTLKRITTEPLDARIDDGYYEFDGTIEFRGTRRSHYRSIKTTPVELDNDFGNDQTTYIGIDDRASSIRWYEPTTGNTTRPSPIATRTAEYGTLDIYDVDASSLTGPGDAGPILTYDLPYEHEGKVDATVWDDHGGGKYDSNNRVRWEKVYTLSHDYEGAIIMDNGLRRVTLAPANSSISAEEWDSANSAWAATSLGASSWELRDADVFRVEPAEVAVQVEFEDTNNPGTFYSLNGYLRRGMFDVLWASPPDQSGATPSGLIDLLDPIASTTLNHAGAETTLIERERVRK